MEEIEPSPEPKHEDVGEGEDEESVDSVFEDISEYKDKPEKVEKVMKMGFNLFRCAMVIKNEVRREISPVRLQSPSVDKCMRKKAKGYLLNFYS
jgi:hypothetical protein